MLRLGMDALFWDMDVSTTQSLDGTARFVPGQPAPTRTARSGRSSRAQQLSFLSHAFPLGILPCFSPSTSSDKEELGNFAFQSFFHGPSDDDNWWTGFVGQFRPKRLIANIKKEVASGDEFDLPAALDAAKQFFDKSLYGLGFLSQFSLTDDTTLFLNAEGQGDKNGPRAKATIFHRLPDHDVTLEAALPELFLDSKGNYWEVPASASLDVASLLSPSGLLYRYGLHTNIGQPKAVNSSPDDVPLSLMPGLCAKGAFSYQKSMDLWRESVPETDKETQDDDEEERPWLASYDSQLKEPHAAISGVFGGTCAAWIGGNTKGILKPPSKKRYPISADLFGSLCYTLQHGKFKDDFNDFTRVDARLDICSASSFIKGVYHSLSDIFRKNADREVDPLASPKLNLLLQQQVAGPIVFRVDSRISLSAKHLPDIEDVIYGLSYSFRLLDTGKILAWYSPKRKEAMIELRFKEF